MSIEQALMEQIRFLTPEQQQEVLDFAALLRQRSPGVSKKKRIPGLHKGNIYWMADDFDAPLSDESATLDSAVETASTHTKSAYADKRDKGVRNPDVGDEH